MKISTKFQLITLLLFVSLQTFAKGNLNWQDLSQEQYIDNLVECKTTLDELKWSYYLSPKNTKTPKRLFSDVVDKDKVRESVLNNLKMQAVLAEKFNLEITPAMLQHDLQRMVNNTQNAKRLQELFDVLDNDATSIAQCVSRPYLVKQKLINNFAWSHQVHQDTQTQAQLDLQDYITGSGDDNSVALVNNITYTLKNKEDTHDKSTLVSSERNIELDPQEFQEKLKQLESTNLQEKDSYFIYSKLLQQTESSIEVENYIWQKQNLQSWLQKQKPTTQLYSYPNVQLPLLKNTGESQLPEIQAGLPDTWKLQNPLQERYVHTAIWTGSEMIIWGGTDNSGNRFNTGNSYDPATDSWIAIDSSSAPAGRFRHTAIWDNLNNQMIVWGGRVSGVSQSGSRYNPISDSWTATSNSGAPSAREYHTAIWDDNAKEMIIWGGRQNGSTYLDTGSRYNPTADTWTTTTTSGAPTARRDHTAVWDDNTNQMIVWGGYNSSSGYLNTGGVYDPVADSWSSTSVSGVPSARYLHTAVWDNNNNKMIVWGGDSFGNYINTGGIYDPVADSWSSTSVSGVPSARGYHTAVWDDNNNKMIIWGGDNNLNTGGIYDPVADSWSSTSVTGVPSGRRYHTAIWDDVNNKMIVWGGDTSTGMTLTGGNYDPTTDSWTATALTGAPGVRSSHTSVWNGNEMMVWGGYTGNNYTNTGGSFNPTTTTWTAMSLSGAPSSRYAHTAIWDDTNNQMIIWGGNSNSGKLSTGGRYNPLSDTWLTTSTSTGTPAARSIHTAVWDSSNSLMHIWGGNDGGYSNTGSSYNPVSDSWAVIDTNTAPDGRRNHTAIWDDVNNQMIVWGGNGASGVLNTGSKYNPTTDSWTMTSMTDVPDSRANHTAIWTGSEMIVWGGFTNSGLSNTGGRYNPLTDSWLATDTSSTATPSGRYEHTAVWTGTQMIVWGGNNNNSYSQNTGGLYRPSTDSWISSSLVDAPEARAQHTAIWTGAEMIVWGGYYYDGFSSAVYYNNMGEYTPRLSYTITGNLTGLNGNQVVIQNNAGDDITLTTDGSFTFHTEIQDGGNYGVTVLTNPTNLNQTCTVTNASGTNIAADVSNVVVNCVTNKYDVNVNVTGLAATNSVSFLNGVDTLTLNADGTGTISNIDDGLSYALSITLQPSTPNQICSFTSSSSGTLAGSDVTINVNCVTTQYNVDVSISGMISNGANLDFNSAYTFFNDGTYTLYQDFDGEAFNISITQQPFGLDQVCSFTNANTGNIAGADVTITVVCITTKYNLDISVTGLAATNSVSFTNGGDSLTVNADGTSTLSNLDDGTAFTVAISAQPTTPNQVCVSDTPYTSQIFGGDYTVSVHCTTLEYNVTLNVTGLDPNAFAVFRLNSSEIMQVFIDGSYNFNSSVVDGQNFDVAIIHQPVPDQNCTLTGGSNNDGSGTMTGNDVIITVNCATIPYNVDVNVSGLAIGASLIVTDGNSNNLTVSTNGTQTLSTLANGSSYTVQVITQPTSPIQQCSAVGQNSGTLSGADAIIQVVCNDYSVSVTVTGLANGDFVDFFNEDFDFMSQTNGYYTFSKAYANNSSYNITVNNQPQNYICVVTGGSNNDGTGIINSADVTDIVITCTGGYYNVYVSAVGMLSGNSLSVTDGNGNNLTIGSQGPQVLATLSDLSTYNVQVTSQPNAPVQNCTVDAPSSGTINGADVFMQVSCDGSYSVSVTITGLASADYIYVVNEDFDSLSEDSGYYTIPKAYADTSAYAITVFNHPAHYTCVVTGGSNNDGTGTINSADVTDIVIACTSPQVFNVGATVTGLAAGNSVVLQNNNGDDLTISSNSVLTNFATAFYDLTSYGVSVLSDPTVPNQICTVTAGGTNGDGSGAIANADVTDVSVVCTTIQYDVNVAVTGLAAGNSISFANSGDALTLNADGTGTLSNLDDGSAYTVSITAQPTAPNQTCSFSNANTGNLAGADAVITVTCTTNQYFVGGSVTGLASGNSVTLILGGQNVAVTSNTYVFTNPLVDESNYAVSVGANPTSPNQTCTVANSTGQIAGADIINVDVTCVTNQYTIGGTVTGMHTGSPNTMVLQNNNGDDLTINNDGSFVFSTSVDDANSYSVSILSQPDSPIQSCAVVNGSSNVAGSDVTDIQINCQYWTDLIIRHGFE